MKIEEKINHKGPRTSWNFPISNIQQTSILVVVPTDNTKYMISVCTDYDCNREKKNEWNIQRGNTLVLQISSLIEIFADLVEFLSHTSFLWVFMYSLDLYSNIYFILSHILSNFICTLFPRLWYSHNINQFTVHTYVRHVSFICISIWT